VDKMLLPEKGYSEYIAKRNCVRNILSSFPQHKYLIQLHENGGSVVTHADATER
jgi:hypothetical protein